MKRIRILSLIFVLIGFVYFCLKDSVPLDFTVLALKQSWILMLVLSSWVLFFSDIILTKACFTSRLSPIKQLIMSLILAHHNLQGPVLLLTYDFFEDTNVYYIDPSNEKFKKIEQYPVNGFSSDIRYIHSYDFLPFLRYIKWQGWEMQ